MSERLVHATSSFLERRTSRRGFLVRSAVVGSALTVSPIRYLVRPENAWAVVQPGACGGRRCAQKFTEFCCSINNGLNVCPSGTFIGGWWKAKAPTGSPICGGRARFYLDCNRFRQSDCPATPGCARNDCDCRRTCQIFFSYFNCNVRKQRGRKSWVVCRMVVCTNPCNIRGGPTPVADANCRCKGPFDNATRFHEACCNCGDCR